MSDEWDDAPDLEPMDVTEYMEVEIAFHGADHWTQEVVHELDRLGYDLDQLVPADVVGDSGPVGRIYLNHVGARDLTIVLRVVPTDDGYKIARVLCGRELDATARQAVPWLKKRSARVKRYLR
jgi:hypothetical protein